MKLQDRTVLVCNCERTMSLDAKALKAALGADAEPTIYQHLCRTQIDGFAKGLESGGRVLVACTQEAPLFREVAQENKADTELAFVNIRERAGWCADKDKATAKIAALLAEAALDITPTGTRTLVSDGMCLIYGAGQQALEVARKLSGRLNVSLLLSDADDVIPPASADVPVYQGRIVQAQGHMGAFEVVVDDYAPMLPSSKDGAQFMMARNGASSTCSLIFDMSGGAPLFTGHDKRDGYVRVDPGDRGVVAEAMFAITDLVGEFEKPIYVDYDGDICAHSRNQKTGCTNCLDNCPAGAISPNGDTVRIDADICGGCGSCSATCPTGAASYAFPHREDLIRRIQVLVSTYLGAGGKRPILLVHDDGHGSEMIGAMARYGRGLPVNVLPLSVYTVTQIGHDALAAAFVAGAEQVVVLGAPDKRDELPALDSQIALMAAFLGALGYDGAEQRMRILVEQDPDRVETELYDLPALRAFTPASFSPVGGKRTVARAALGKLAEQAPASAEIVPLPQGAPYGRVGIDASGCTLCLACVSCCPADALHDNPDQPQVRLIESACVQCGLCAKTCPEKVITLEPRINFAAGAMTPQVLHEEEPFHCVSCGKPFGTRSTVERISKQLAGKHAMFQDAEAQKLIQMCDSCRITAQADKLSNPFAMGERPRVRTTEDYVAVREGRLKADDFLIDE